MIKSLIYRGTDGVIVLAVFLTINDKKVQNIRFDTIYLKLWKKYSPPAYIDSIWWWWWGGLGWQGHQCQLEKPALGTDQGDQGPEWSIIP